MTQMNAVQLTSFGGTENLHLTQVDLPVPGPGQVRVRLVAGSVNPVDLIIRRGESPVVDDAALPYVGGRDVAGHVEAVGPGVYPAWLGQAVWGVPGFDRGAFAECILLEEEEFSAAPVGYPLDEAGTMPLAALTAWQALHRYGGLRAGQSVLIHGGSGGVGHLAVQMAHAAGARVIATASVRNADMVRGLGADVVIARDRKDFADMAEKVDLVLDLVGGSAQERSWQVLRQGGRLVSAVKTPDPTSVQQKGAEGSCFFIAEPRRADFEAMAQLVTAGQLRVVIAQWVPLAETARGQEALQAGGQPGKIGIRI